MSSRDSVVTRSRTNLFLSFRDSAARPSTRVPVNRYGHDGAEETEALIDGDAAAVAIDMPSAPPAWLDAADRLDGLLDRVRPKLTQLDKLHAKHILPGFADRTAEEQTIERLTREITQDLRGCHTLIQQIAAVESKLRSSRDPRSGDLALARNAQTAAAAKVQQLSSVFRRKQSVYLQRLRGQETYRTDASTSSATAVAADSLAAAADDVQMSQREVQRTATVSLSSTAIDRRDREVVNIAESITELAELFKDLSALVIDQGTLFDRIDYNVEQMATHVRAAATELETATRYQRRHGKRRLLCLLILLVIGAVIVLWVKTSSGARGVQ